MKKIYKKFLAISAVILALTACDDKLDLQAPTKIGDKVALATDKNVKLTLIGAYNALSNTAAYGGGFLLNSELLASNSEIVFSGTFSDPSDIWRKSTTTINGDVADTWIAAYNTINISNNILSAIDVVNEEDQDQVEGEALFIRGVCYFELVKYYGQPYSAGGTSTNLGVPIMLVENRNSVDQVSRATVEEVYDQVLSDLTLAESLLPEGPNENKATKEAAAAMLSRVYLQMADYANARDAADRVIEFAEDGNYSLNDDYADAFNGGTTLEDIFDIPVSTQDGVNSMQTYYASTALSGGRGDIEIQSEHLDLYEAGDARLAFHYEDEVTGETRTGKWMNQYGNVKIIRLSEMYLTRAEANFREGTTTGADPLDDVNLVRERAGLDPYGSLSIDEILLERHLELAHEGHYLHDIKRTEGTVVEGIQSFPFNHVKLVFPIPQRDRNVNENLVQNDGY